MPFGWGRPKEEPVLVPAGAGGRGGGGGGGGGYGTAPAPPQAAGRNRVPAGGYAPPNQQPMRPQPKQLLDAGAVAIAYWGAAPDYIKLIKQIRMKPFIFTATGAISPRTRRRFINFSLRETLFDGAFICHVSRRSLEYRNNLPLPIAGVGSVVLAAEWRLGQPLHKPRLMVALGTDAGAAVMRPGAIAWRKAFFVNRNIGIETAADVSVAMGYDFNDSGGGGTGSNGFKLNFDVRELNVVCRI